MRGYSCCWLAAFDAGSLQGGWSSSIYGISQQISTWKVSYLEVFKWFLVVLHRTVCDSQLTQCDAFRLCFSLLASPLQSSLQEAQRMLILALETMADAEVVVSGKAIFVIWEFEVLMMEGDALLCLSTVEKVDCHSVSSQRHTYLILHCFCKT